MTRGLARFGAALALALSTLQGCADPEPLPLAEPVFTDYFAVAVEMTGVQCRCDGWNDPEAESESCDELQATFEGVYNLECVDRAVARFDDVAEAYVCATEAGHSLLDCRYTEGCIQREAEFTCEAGDVIPGSLQCDGENDCADESDEAYCEDIDPCFDEEQAYDACMELLLTAGGDEFANEVTPCLQSL